jgi:glycerophosphoryl diester phosphodiesterase
MAGFWDHRHKDCGRPLVIAHRGASAIAVENTRAAIERALDLDVDGVEIDVRITGDGVAVLAHDPDLRRLARSDLVVAATPLSELRSAFPDLLTLDQALALASDSAVVLDIKPIADEELAPIYAAIRAHDTHPGLILAAQLPSQWNAAARYAPNRTRLGLVSDADAPAFVDAGGAWIRFSNRPDLADRMADARAKGLGVVVVTGHRDYPHTLDPAVIDAAIKLEPDAVIIDDPTQAFRALA